MILSILGESIKTSDAADKVTIVANNGKEITILGDDTLALNQNTIGSDGLADVSALQNAILNGGDLTKLEETAAGGNAAAAGGGDGVSLSDARFADGGHYSNINENYRNLTDANRAFASYDSPIGGYSDGNGGDLTPPDPRVSVEFTEDKNNDGFLTYTENFDKNARSHDLNTSPVKITVTDVAPGDILHITLTKPDGTVTPLSPITINDTDIVNNTFTKIISDMPVAEGKISKVDAYVTDSADPNTIKSNKASDSVEPDVRPTLKFTEDQDSKDGDGYLNDKENSKDNDFRSTTVEITLPKDVVAGDKIVITYTDPLTKQDTTKEVPLKQADVDNHKVNTSLPVFPDVTNTARVHVETHDSIRKSEDSDKDSVKPIGRNMEIQFIEQDTLHEISRQESMDEHEVNKTTALIRLPNKIDNGDIVTLTINEPIKGVYKRDFTIEMNKEGEVIGIKEIGNGGKDFPLTKEDFNQYSFKVPGFDLRHGQNTTIKASITNNTTGRHTSINEPEVSASLEHVKAPVVEFNQKVINRESLKSDDEGMFRTTATIKIPKNAVDGDRIEVKITEPQLVGPAKDRTLKFNVHKDASGVKITDEHGNNVELDKDNNGFTISNVGTLTGAETKISATIIDKDNVQSATGTNSVSVTELDDSGIFFAEDIDANKSITREESMKDHYFHKEKGDLCETDDYLHKTDLKVKVPNNVITGDKMILEVNGNKTDFTITRNGNSITLTHGTNTITADSDNKITVPEIAIGEGKNTEAKATFTDAKGFAKTTIVTNNATLENLHDDMTVIFNKDKDFNGILNKDEATKDSNGKVVNETTATIKLPSNVVDGDVLKITTSIENGTSTTTSHTIHKDAKGNITVDGPNVVGVVGNKAVEYTVPLKEDKKAR